MANNTGKKFGGRQLGTPNKTQAQLRTSINYFISKNWKTIQKDFNKMDPKDKLSFMEKLIKHVLPSLSNNSTTINYNKMTTDNIDRIIEGLKNSINEQSE